MHEGIEKVILNHLPTHEIASHWVLHNTELCHNLFTFVVGVIPHISPSLQTKRLLCSKEVDIAGFEKKHANILVIKQGAEVDFV